MSDKPLDLESIDKLWQMNRRASESTRDQGAAQAYADTAKALAELRTSRIEINRLTANAEADAFEIGRLVAEIARLKEGWENSELRSSDKILAQFHEIGRLNDQVNKLREYVEYAEIDKDGRDDWSEIVEYHERGKLLRAAIGRGEDGSWTVTP